MPSNGDTLREFKVGKDVVLGLGSYHKSLPHDDLGEVCQDSFREFVAATQGDGAGFASVRKGSGDAAPLTNPQAGLAADQLTHHPASYAMPPAPEVLSPTCAAEMTELYWMANLRDLPFNEYGSDESLKRAAKEVTEVFQSAMSKGGSFILGTDVPGNTEQFSGFHPENAFRLGLPGEETGPMISQFFVRPIAFGTQTIEQTQRPYKENSDYLTGFEDWLHAQRSGRDRNGQAYNKANEDSEKRFEKDSRYISTMRDLARFVNKDALHQAYFNAALILLSGDAKWTNGNPYSDCGRLKTREAGFGTLGGPHILALVSEVATRALKVVWNQKWQVHLRLRPEAYGGLVHVQNEGVGGKKRPYGLPPWVAQTDAAKQIREKHQSLLLPMAFTPGSPTHPAYGAGHATVAGACVTVLKAYFKTFETKDGVDTAVPFNTLVERDQPYDPKATIKAYQTGKFKNGWDREELCSAETELLTIEGELNKLAQNVAMGRSMGGVHWRTDNSRSLVLGEAIASEILADISTDLNERPSFEFRTFSRGANGLPRKVRISAGKIYVEGKLVDTHGSSL